MTKNGDVKLLGVSFQANRVILLIEPSCSPEQKSRQLLEIAKTGVERAILLQRASAIEMGEAVGQLGSTSSFKDWE